MKRYIIFVFLLLRLNGIYAQELAAIPNEQLNGNEPLTTELSEELILNWAVQLGTKAKDVCAGGYHTVVITEDGKILQYGLGSRQEEESTVREIRIPSSDPIREVVCGDYHTLALTENGELWSWGRNGIALGEPTVAESMVPRRVELSQERVVSVGAGYEHSIAVTDTGKVYGWGSGQFGQNGFTEEEQVPKLIEDKSLKNVKVASVCCAGHHSVLLTDNGKIFTFGSSDFGRLGHGQEKNHFNPSPKLVKVLNPVQIQQVSCGGDHTLALSVEGKVYSWGWNDHGQLGLSDTESRYIPKHVIPLSSQRVKHVSLGKYAHSFALTENGTVLGWGWNEDGQLGLSDLDARYSPAEASLFRNIEIVKIEGGFKHSVALTANGDVLLVGNNVYGQLGEHSQPFEIANEGDRMYSSNASLPIGIAEAINIRAAMEDATVALENFGGDHNMYFFAVYDGHGGTTAVNYAAQNLHRILFAEMGSNVTTEESFKRTYERVEKEISTKDVDLTGSTAVTLLVQKNQTHFTIACANIGDSRAVLSSGAQAIRLSYDHRASDPKEKERLNNAGSFVSNGRVRGNLEVSRAFGDTMFDKQKEVIAEPFISSAVIEAGKGNFLILGSDGLWDVFGDQEAVDFVSKEGNNWDPEEQSQKLLQAAIGKGSKDNVAVLLVRL